MKFSKLDSGLQSKPHGPSSQQHISLYLPLNWQIPKSPQGVDVISSVKSNHRGVNTISFKSNTHSANDRKLHEMGSLLHDWKGLRIEEHKLLVLPIEAAQTSAIFRSIVIGSNMMTGNVTIDVTSEPIYFCIICQ
ncbi:hypothetical protein WN944_028090 [Citrus x changshan-huyou]|uniref:Uncharacterized protein n=1 Tax=Citrus x changshan-huyou TaxID=2935761 RepID=A0AAP0LIQ6_9ROSI